MTTAYIRPRANRETPRRLEAETAKNHTHEYPIPLFNKWDCLQPPRAYAIQFCFYSLPAPTNRDSGIPAAEPATLAHLLVSQMLVRRGQKMQWDTFYLTWRLVCTFLVFTKSIFHLRNCFS